jgi:hypothetical protein
MLSVCPRSVQCAHTLALAHNSRPPMGANMIPMAKKMGRTVLGVRIGLAGVSAGISWIGLWRTDCHAFNLCCRKAVSAQ